MSTWGATLLPYFILAAEPVITKTKEASPLKLVAAVAIVIIMIVTVYMMLRSLGFDKRTPPTVVFRKIMFWFRAQVAVRTLSGKLNKAEELESKGKLGEASQIYLNNFLFDGLMSTNAKVAMHNEELLERIEEVCVRAYYDFPADRINRYREDLYDYFLVRERLLDPDGAQNVPLHRAENEERFKNSLNLSQEKSLIEGFQNMLTSVVKKLQNHMKGGARIRSKEEAQAVLREQAAERMEQAQIQQQAVAPAAPAPSAAPSLFGGASENPFGSAPASNPFDQEIASPFDDSPGDPFGGMSSSPPAAPFGSSGGDDIPNPFGSSAPIDNPIAPPTPPSSSPDDDAFGDLLSRPPEPEPAPPVPAMGAPMASGMPQPTGGFPGMAGGQPQPTGGFPGMTGGQPQPTGGFPGLGGPPANGPAGGGFPGLGAGQPQPTGGFPGLGGGQPQPTGGFPGMTGGQPQPTGGFPGFGGGQPQPTGGFPGLGGGQPQPTGGFPGMTGGQPQPTGGFPGFGSNPPQPSGFPQPTGGFPGSNPPASNNPFGNNKK